MLNLKNIKKLRKKKYQITLLWRELILEQFVFWDFLDFQHQVLIEWSVKFEEFLLDLLNKSIIKWDKFIEDDLLNIDFIETWTFLRKTVFSWCFINEEDISEEKLKEIKEKLKENIDEEDEYLQRPLSTWLLDLSEIFHLDPDSILNRYTFESIIEYLEWFIYKENDKTPEWEMKNKVNLMKKKLKDENVTSEDVESSLEELDKKFREAKEEGKIKEKELFKIKT